MSVEEKLFREDLYYRLKVFQITIPPLRDHKEDIPALTEYFIQQFNMQFRKKITQIDPEVITMLTNYNWPGNVRELRNLLERAVILEPNGRLHIESFPNEITLLVNENRFNETPSNANLRNKLNDGGTLFEVEKQMLIDALEKTNYNQTQASKLLGISRDTLRYRMKKYSL